MAVSTGRTLTYMDEGEKYPMSMTASEKLDRNKTKNTAPMRGGEGLMAEGEVLQVFKSSRLGKGCQRPSCSGEDVVTVVRDFGASCIG